MYEKKLIVNENIDSENKINLNSKNIIYGFGLQQINK